MPPPMTCRPGIAGNGEARRIAALRQYHILDTLPDREFDIITRTVQHVFNVPMTAITFIDSYRQWFKSEIGMDRRETDRASSFCNRTIEGSGPMAVADALEDPRFSSSPLVCGPPHIRAYLGAPLPTPEGHNIGVLCIMDHAPRAFSSRDGALLTHFAQLVMERLELRRSISEDMLTGACMRRAFEEQFAAALHRRQGSGDELTLVLFDIDEFKAFNDTYGHPVGDRILRAVGRCTRSMIRPGDIFGRIGGDEFAIVLNGTPLATAERRVERLRRRFAAIRLAEAPDAAVTASFGLAGAPAGATAQELMKIADAALYAAKGRGKNAVHMSTGLLPGGPGQGEMPD
uniref:diguanylate cyclase n=1 Tax=Cereibacter sphaeroides (strain ATCC 17025 / ATH 2.4.3) TaxID=349102 RepID=A4X064_CERS5